MTLEENKEHIRRYSNGLWGMVRVEHIDKMIDQIYRDHEEELEALQQRSCESCIYFNKQIGNGFCFRLNVYVTNTFFCQGHEPKEQ